MTFRALTAILLLAALAAACAPAATPTEPAVVEPPSVAPQPSEPSPVEPAATDEAAAGTATYTFITGETVARFVIDEVLSGNPKTVIGVTNRVTGTMSFDLSTPSQATLGQVQVDLTSLETDSGFRNRAIREAILQTGKDGNQFATFTATQIEGLPETVTTGTSYELQITGDLTIMGTTRQVTFDAVVTPVSADRIEGTASLTVPYADFGVEIPFLPPQVASVADIVRLEIDLAAAR